MPRPLLLLDILQLQSVCTQVMLKADGPGNTYSLITSVLAPGHHPIEVPDCSHEAFGDHIDEIFDNDLNAYVFRFHIHTSPDNDGCLNLHRQRNEIKSYDKSPPELLGIEGETIAYKWKFKLTEDFQSSPNFTHIHQLKSVGGSLSSMPMYTLTTRKGNPDKIELRYAETEKQVTLQKQDLAPLIGTWLEVTENIKYGLSGTYSIEIKNIDESTTLFEYSTNSIINWREDSDFVRPKWGICRSLINDQDLRDEEVLFADFEIEEMLTTSSENVIKDVFEATIIPNPAQNKIIIQDLSERIIKIQIFGLDGKLMIDQTTDSNNSWDIDVSALYNGPYIVKMIEKGINQSKLIFISK